MEIIICIKEPKENKETKTFYEKLQSANHPIIEGYEDIEMLTDNNKEEIYLVIEAKKKKDT